MPKCKQLCMRNALSFLLTRDLWLECFGWPSWESGPTTGKFSIILEALQLRDQQLLCLHQVKPSSCIERHCVEFQMLLQSTTKHNKYNTKFYSWNMKHNTKHPGTPTEHIEALSQLWWVCGGHFKQTKCSNSAVLLLWKPDWFGVVFWHQSHWGLTNSSPFILLQPMSEQYRRRRFLSTCAYWVISRRMGA